VKSSAKRCEPLRRVEEERELQMERLRAAIREGEGALARGEYIDLNTEEEVSAFFASL